MLASSRCSELEGTFPPFCVESEIYLWDISTPYSPRHDAPMKRHTGIISKIMFNPNSEMFVTVADGKEVILWDASANDSLPIFAEHFPVHKSEVTALTSDYSGNILFSADEKGNIIVSEISDSFRQRGEYRGQAPPGCFAPEQDGGLMILRWGESVS